MVEAFSDPPARDASEMVTASEFDFIPDALRSQCRNLIKSYHEMHGYASLPDILWKAGLSNFINKHRNLRRALKTASTTRSARTANAHFVMIATEALALEMLARGYGNWGAMLPSTAAAATRLLEASLPAQRTSLMDQYLYPPRFDSPAMTIAPPPAALYRPADEAESLTADADVRFGSSHAGTHGSFQARTAVKP